MEALEEKLGYRFQQRALLENALTHSSYANENKARGCQSNERLEFLGDSVLGMVTAVLKQETAVPDDSLFIRELEYTLAQGKYEMTYYRRFIFKGRRIYQASIGAQNRYIDLLQKKRETFFNSISFTDEENSNHLNP